MTFRVPTLGVEGSYGRMEEAIYNTPNVRSYSISSGPWAGLSCTTIASMNHLCAVQAPYSPAISILGPSHKRGTRTALGSAKIVDGVQRDLFYGIRTPDFLMLL